MGVLDPLADGLGIEALAREPRGADVLKVDAERILTPANGSVVLVTAMTPTPHGEGKTTTVVGLLDGLRRRGVRAVGALREPSLGPVFGAKGGAVGGGRARLVPEASINLHFTGDIHAVTTAHNLLAAMVDNHLFHGTEPRIQPDHVRWNRVMDMNDRALRRVEVGLAGKGEGHRTGRFDITAASEVMAILCLSRNVEDLRARLDRILVGTDGSGRAVTAKDLGASGAMAALLLEATRPNLVRTLEGNPVFLHGGPFANVAQGTSSLIQTQLCRRVADVVVTEAGFAFDLGGFKFLDLKARLGGFAPAAVVLVMTVRALRYHGGQSEQARGPDVAAVERGLSNVEAHLDSMARLGLAPPVLSLNRFPDDTPEELALVEAMARRRGVTLTHGEYFARGGEGALPLADAVMALLNASPKDSPGLTLPYRLEQPVEEKVTAVARTVLGADGVVFSAEARQQLAEVEALGLAGLPICLAKTHLSISDRSEVKGRPPPFTLQVSGVRASAGAGFLVVLCGAILTMPGLHARAAAVDVDIERDGTGGWRIRGLH